MTFEDALTAMRQGKTVKRADWSECTYDIGDLMQRPAGYMRHMDMLADDWEIVGITQPDPTIEELRSAVVLLADKLRMRFGWPELTDNAIDALRRQND